MFAFLTRLLLVVRSRMRSPARLKAENLVLRHQAYAAKRSATSRQSPSLTDSIIYMFAYRVFRQGQRRRVQVRYRTRTRLRAAGLTVHRLQSLVNFVRGNRFPALNPGDQIIESGVTVRVTGP